MKDYHRRTFANIRNIENNAKEKVKNAKMKICKIVVFAIYEQRFYAERKLAVHFKNFFQKYKIDVEIILALSLH